MNDAELIKQYKELLDMGAITQEEYDFKKKSLLGMTEPSAPAPASPAPAAFANNVPAPQPVPANIGSADPIRSNVVVPDKRTARNGGKAKPKKMIIAAVAAITLIALVAVVAIVAVSKHGTGNSDVVPAENTGILGELPAGVQMGDSLDTVKSKVDKLNPSSKYAEEYVNWYIVENGTVYGYSFEKIQFEFNQNDQLTEVWIWFSDPELDISKLVEEVSKVYGESTYSSEFDEYKWTTEDFNEYVYAKESEPGKVDLQIYMVELPSVSSADDADTLEELPAGVQMDDSLDTVISKASEIESVGRYSSIMSYTLENGKIYGYHFEKLKFFVTEDTPLYWVEITFDDLKLDMKGLVDKVCEAYGEPSLQPADGIDHYRWDTDSIYIRVSESSSGKLSLEFHSLFYDD